MPGVAGDARASQSRGPPLTAGGQPRELVFEAGGFWPGGEDQGPCLNELLFGFTGRVFVDDEVLLDVGFDAARAGLGNLTGCGSLTSASKDAYGEGIAELIRVGPLSSVPGMSKLVEVRFRDLVERDDCAGLAVRWETIGPGGGLFPALDADIKLRPAGKQTTMLALAGSYRPPLGALGTVLDVAILHRAAAATIRGFLNRVADAITHPPASAA